MSSQGIVDVHAHAGPNPPWPTAEERLERMDAAGIAIQVLGHGATIPHDQTTVEYCGTYNDFLAEHVVIDRERLLGWALLPLPDVTAASAELRRAVTELGLIGAGISTTIGIEFDDPTLDQLYDTLQELDVPLFVHGGLGGLNGFMRDRRLELRPTDPPSPFARWGMAGLLGFAYEEAITAISMIFGGVLDRHPQLDVCLTHVGGAFPLLYPRLRLWGDPDTPLPPQLPERFVDPAEFDRLAQRLWFDTDVDNAQILEFAEGVLNTERLVPGTNFSGYAEPVVFGLDDAKKAQLSANARRLLRLDGASA